MIRTMVTLTHLKTDDLATHRGSRGPNTIGRTMKGKSDEKESDDLIVGDLGHQWRCSGACS
jgi:hypothetical protein